LIAFGQSLAHAVKSAGEETDLIIGADLDALRVVALTDLARAFGKLQYGPGNSARDPDPDRDGDKEPQERKKKESALETQIRGQFLIERTLQKRDCPAILGRERDGVTNELFAAESEINDFFYRGWPLVQE
jgi:hypothetical protein